MNKYRKTLSSLISEHARFILRLKDHSKKIEEWSKRNQCYRQKEDEKIILVDGGEEEEWSSEDVLMNSSQMLG